MMFPIGNDSVSIHLNQSETKMELYSIVLSTTMLCLAMVFGTGGNITILVSLCTYRLLRKHHYILIAMFLVTCLILDIVWCPMEIYHLIQHHHDNTAVDATFTFAGQSLYIFLITTILCILSIVSVQSLCKLSSNWISRHFVLALTLAVSLILVLSVAVGYGVLSSIREGNTKPTEYQILNEESYNYRIIVYSFSLWMAISFVMLITLVICRRKTAKDLNVDIASEYSEPPTPERLNIPTLLIKGSEEEGSDNEKEEDKKSISNSQRFLSMQGASSTKEDNMSTIGELPSPSKSKISSNHLGVNMAAILGRRRHTIGQIGPTGLDVGEKTKQYNYVRKFSVDIEALQAQLENPKVYGGAISFRSDTELQKSTQNDNKMELPQRPHTPLLDMRLSGLHKTQLEEKNEENSDEENVDKDDDVSNKEDYDMENANHICEKLQNSSHETLSPPIITLSETTGDELNEPMADNRFNKGMSHYRLTCLLLVTFVCCLLPMFITEAVRGLLSQRAYINILTCTMSLSVVQTIIFPHILFCMDNFTHLAVHTFFGKVHAQVMHMCYGHHQVPTSEHVDITVTQV
ncbi:uncharacterized protein LOC117329059 [Pecten maximus]|uniref:uncharacterized protein LOC117329059 n=1 Tax=Pecten maximus TaxID=6579 RepID=UPI001458789C|nr:uncharacterized protein LOC117329059 [Pecten maximus]XP_033742649.1 uncharacterized protein LOC117329059 [Pecten maximus]XP_033742650.1 uncharacterized protein LOC117329059 [Pecten maximus]XP_033742652.1 uncharacterized protein LOC117329059 [Pecten maximus]XP_033742653.1 uncharacterized protein LOC117329059 [Pecten maximus]XP_033742654.1 uncharacterized protein LOC117329059 [Pecten maximus]XP_033742655.1 uncharacterized protein LOC117329059 [Pecten maximus]